MIGCIQVSKTEKNHDLQFDALKKSGCKKIYSERFLGHHCKDWRYKMISELKKEDVIVVWRFDRLARTIYELIKLMVK